MVRIELFQMPLNGVVTNIIKLTVGRPRPFFLAACFPDGKVPADAYGRPLPLSDCTNTDAHVVSDSRHVIKILNRGSLTSRLREIWSRNWKTAPLSSLTFPTT